MGRILEFKCTPIMLVFSAKDSDYKIYATESSDKTLIKNEYGNVTILGNVAELSLGIEYTIKATETNTKRGLAYKIKSFTRDKPLTDAGVRLFLEEILPFSQVEELMREYPNIIDLVINNRMDEVDLNKLYNIKHERIKVIHRKILENFVFAQVVEEFQGLIDFKIIKDLYNKFKDIDMIKTEIKNDPYGVLTSIGGLDFKNADTLLMKFEKDCAELEAPPIKFDESLITSYVRMEGCIIYVIEKYEFDGNTKINKDELYKRCKTITSQCISKFEKVLKESIKLVVIKNYVSKKSTYDCEIFIAQTLLDGIKTSHKWDIDISDYKTKGEFPLVDNQMNAIQNVMDYNVSILNGFSGAGKSFSTKLLVRLLQDNNKSITLLAPTGRAGKVLSKYANYPASTIHRLLYQLEDGESISSDVVIVDEISMADVFLFKWLLSKIDLNYTKLLLIGDSAQIPSVSAGNVLHDLLNSNIIPTTTLTEIFRYGVGGVMTVATNTRQQEAFLENKDGMQVIGEDKGYIFYHTINPKNALTLVKQFYSKLLTKNSPEDILILSPYNIGASGSQIINSVIQPIANPSSVGNPLFIDTDESKFYIGDLILQTKNNYSSKRYINCGWDKEDSMAQSKYDLEDNKILISNGDIGIVEHISGNLCIIDFDGIKVVYDKFDLLTCRLGYCVSIMRSQGGNAKNIILVTTSEHEKNLNSNLLYVGETRARERVYHIGSHTTVNKALSIKAENDRLTHLKDLMEELND